MGFDRGRTLWTEYFGITGLLNALTARNPFGGHFFPHVSIGRDLGI